MSERKKILELVAGGKLSVDDADEILGAIEGGGATGREKVVKRVHVVRPSGGHPEERRVRFRVETI